MHKVHFNYVLEHNFHFAAYENMTLNAEPLLDEGSILSTNKLQIFDVDIKEKYSNYS